MAPKLGRVETYLERFQPIKLHNPLTMWPCKITWQIKNIVSLLPTCLWPPKLTEWWLILRGSFPYRHMTLNKVVFVVDFRDNLKNYISLLSQDLWPLKLAACWLWGKDSARKRLSRHRLVVSIWSVLSFFINEISHQYIKS